MIKNVLKQSFEDGKLNYFVSGQFYEIRRYVRNYFRETIKFTEVVRPPVWDTWNKSIRDISTGDQVDTYFNESDPSFLAFKCDNGVLYYKIEKVLKK